MKKGFFVVFAYNSIINSGNIVTYSSINEKFHAFIAQTSKSIYFQQYSQHFRNISKSSGAHNRINALIELQ